MKYGLQYCPKCKCTLEIIYVYPDKAVLLKCDHEISLEEQKKFKD